MADSLPSEELIEEPSDYGSLRPGTRLGRYELLVPVARGGMARVWAARLHGQRGFQKLVAIKTILPHLADVPEFERMFLDEARIASGVHHPNVCEIYELGEDKNVLYLAMEWVSGDSLARVLRASGRSEAIDARVAARIVADACAGLHVAHELTDDVGRQLGVVHRDLSPHNILLTADGVAKIADFGVAKALGQLHDSTSTGQLKGKLAYMPPEQITGGGIDRRSDIFTLGCVLYEATTGERPFKGDGDHQVMNAILNAEVAPPSSIVRGYPKELEHIVLRALASQPIVRFPTAERMRLSLEEFLARGMVVTQSNVAQVVRMRIGETIERRREQIRQAESAGGQAGFDATGSSALEKRSDGPRSGVQHASPHVSHVPAATEHGAGSMPAVAGPGTPPPSASDRPRISYSQPPPAPSLPALLTPRDPSHHPDYSHSGYSGYGMSRSGYPLTGVAPIVTYPPIGAGPSSAVGTARYYAVAASVGVLLAAMIASGGYLIWRSQVPSEAASPVARPAAVSAPAPAPSSASAASTSGAPTAARARPRIVLDVMPTDAHVIVDGRELSTDERTVVRPEPGARTKLVVSAPGYEEREITVDADTPAPIVVVLDRTDTGASPARRFDALRPRPAPAAPPKGEGKADPNLPANPY